MKLKAIICFLMIMVIVFSCSACCSQFAENSDGGESNIDIISGDTSTDNSNFGNPSSEIPLTMLKTYDEYISFIEDHEIPENFVTYDMLKLFGAFDSLVMLCRVECNDYSFYLYNLIDESGANIMLYVDCGRIGPTSEPLPLIENFDSSDMRYSAGTDKGRYVYNGIEYTYINGGLHTISWKHDGREFDLYMSGGLTNYPENAQETIVGQLMNIQNAGEAMTSIALSLQIAE